MPVLRQQPSAFFSVQMIEYKLRHNTKPQPVAIAKSINVVFPTRAIRAQSTSRRCDLRRKTVIYPLET